MPQSPNNIPPKTGFWQKGSPSHTTAMSYTLDTTLPRLGQCRNTPTPATTPRLHYHVAMHCAVMWGLSSAVISSLHYGIHPPSRNGEISSEDKWTASSPCGRGIEQSHTNTVLSPHGVHLSMYSCI